MGREEDRRRGADVSFSGEQHAHALVVGRGDALHSMEIIESGGGLCVLAAMIQSPLPWDQLRRSLLLPNCVFWWVFLRWP